MAKRTVDANVEKMIPYALAMLAQKSKAPSRLAHYRDDPVAFINDFIKWPEGQGLTGYQEAILSALPLHKRVAAYGPHGLGKTTMEALALIWFSMTREDAKEDWKNPTLASAWRQLDHYLWPEVHKWARLLDWRKLQIDPWDPRYQLQTLGLKLRYGESFALASDSATSLEGAHANSLFYTFDESKAIPAETWDAVEGAFSSAGPDTSSEALAFACSTPGEESGRFYEICSRKPGYEDWHVIRVTLAEALQAGRISEQWAEQRRRQWGDSSPVYINRVLGDFASSDASGVIPLRWVELAVERWKAWNEQGTPGKLSHIGVDVGGGGDGADLTTLALREKNTVWEIRRESRGDTMSTVGKIRGVQDVYSGMAIVDAIGIGAGVVSRLRELGADVHAFNAAQGAGDARDSSGELGFANLRAWGWWNLRELLDPANGADLALPDDDLLIGDLTAPRWRVLSGGRILIESKDEIRKRLGRSTDTGDAVVMAFALDSSLSVGEILFNNDDMDRRSLVEDFGFGKGGAVMSGMWGKEW